MASDHSFDIASKIDKQEVLNAVNQANKEIGHRYDLNGTNSEIDIKQEKNELYLSSSDDYKIKAVSDILKQKLIKRDISLKALNEGNIQQSAGDTVKQVITLQSGIPTDSAKDIVKDIKATKVKVQTQIQGDQVRVTSKKIDDLQQIMQLLKKKEYPFHIQFLNYR